MTESFDADYWLVVSPEATGDQLRDVAARRFDLHQLIVVHQNAYPELVQWINEQSAPAAQHLVDTVGTATVVDPRVDGGAVTGVIPAGAAPSPRKRRVLIGAIAAAVALVVFGVGLGAFLLLPSKGASTSADPFKKMPQSARVIDLSTDGAPVQLIPVGSENQQTLQQGSLLLVGMVADGDYQVSAIDMKSDLPYPMWTLPVADHGGGGALGCSLSGDIFSCGSMETYNIAGGAPIPVAKAESGADAQGGSLASEEGAEGEEDGDGTEQGAEGSGDGGGTEEDADGGGDSGTEGGEDQSGALEQNPAILLPDQRATDGVPMPYVSGGALFGANGKQISDAHFGRPLYGVQVGTKGDRWVVSDGYAVLGLNGAKEVWTLDLPVGSEKVNGFADSGSPKLNLAGNTLLLGTPNAIIALDASTGEERWAIDTEVDSWEVHGSALIVSGAGVLSVLPFPEEGGTEGGEGGGALKLGLPTIGAQMPTEEEILNSTMTVDANCLEFVTGDAGSNQSVSFVDGIGQTQANYGAELSVKVWGFTVLNGRPVAIINHYCYGGGTTGFDVVTAVDSDLEVVTGINISSNQSAWVRRPPSVNNIDVAGTQLVIDISGFETVGPSITYVSAQSTLMWDGTEYVPVDWLYELGSGRVVRPPNVEELQDIYDAVADGDEASVSHYFGSQGLAYIDSPGFGGDGPTTAREMLWAPGGKVEGCGLLPPASEQLYDLGGSGLSTPPPDQVRYMSSSPGDFICGITSPKVGTWGDSFSIWWVVTTDEDGAIVEIQQGRNFA